MPLKSKNINRTKFIAPLHQRPICVPGAHRIHTGVLIGYKSLFHTLHNATTKFGSSNEGIVGFVMVRKTVGGHIQISLGTRLI